MGSRLKRNSSESSLVSESQATLRGITHVTQTSQSIVGRSRRSGYDDAGGSGGGGGGVGRCRGVLGYVGVSVA